MWRTQWQLVQGAITPYIFSVPTVLLTLLAVGLYALGWRRLAAQGRRPSWWRLLSFGVGVLLCYVVMHTQFDYYARFMFFMHRLQHMVLHHLGAFLIALSNPLPIFAAAFGARRFPRLALVWRPLRRLLFDPVVATVLFVGLIFFWLSPVVHFDAMLNLNLYELMNWSMLVDGVIFWLVILDPRDPDDARTSRFGVRFLMLLAALFPQILLGAYITFSDPGLYDVYAVCGRAWPMSAATDQVLGGIFTWIPPAMMTILGALVVLRLYVRHESKKGESHAPSADCPDHSGFRPGTGQL
ncbi:cytochrome c oxidase assembly protein [Alloalcanivorax mobilis]|uniref:cytochrome c oxidase assembly protein n=1 Tax=Alloalcanivorax mobilis TaxID=2019569 RepID=UPI000C779FE6|nr:cytochrome c oxidase assembly protein [Alloalcanivorax mobilis]